MNWRRSSRACSTTADNDGQPAAARRKGADAAFLDGRRKRPGRAVLAGRRRTHRARRRAPPAGRRPRRRGRGGALRARGARGVGEPRRRRSRPLARSHLRRRRRQRARTRRCDTVIFLAGAELLERFLAWASAHEWLPDLLLPASSAPPESLATIAMAAWIALPTGPFDRTPRGLADYRALQELAPLRPDFPTRPFASL